MSPTFGASSSGASTSSDAWTVALPDGAAVGDTLGIFWAGLFTGTVFAEPPFVVSAVGVETGGQVSTGPANDGLSMTILGVYSVRLSTADIAAGYYTIGPANLSSFDGSVTGTYPSGYQVFLFTVPASTAYQPSAQSNPNGYQTPIFFPDGVSTLAIVAEYLDYDSSGNVPTNASLSNVASVADAAGGTFVLSIGSFEFDIDSDPDSLGPRYIWDPVGTDTSDFRLSGIIVFGEAVPAVFIDPPVSFTLTPGDVTVAPSARVVVDEPAALTLSIGDITVTKTVPVIIDTPAQFSLAGGDPAVTPLEKVAIDTPAALSIIGGETVVQVATVFDLVIDTAAEFALIGATPDVSAIGEPGDITINIVGPANFAFIPASPDVVATAIELVIDGPAQFALVGATPVVTPTATEFTIAIDEPAAFTLAPGTIDVLAAVPVAITVDSPASFTLSGGSPVVAVVSNQVMLAIDEPASFNLTGGGIAVTVVESTITITITTPAALELLAGSPLVETFGFIRTPAHFTVTGGTIEVTPVFFGGPRSLTIALYVGAAENRTFGFDVVADTEAGAFTSTAGDPSRVVQTRTLYT